GGSLAPYASLRRRRRLESRLQPGLAAPQPPLLPSIQGTIIRLSEIHALAARQARGKLGPLAYDLGPLAEDQVEIDVQYCGICHSDLSMLNNDWGITQYPLVPGHEAIGKISAMGRGAKSVHVGQT